MSVLLQWNETAFVHIHERRFFILDFPDGPGALWEITDDRLFFMYKLQNLSSLMARQTI